MAEKRAQIINVHDIASIVSAAVEGAKTLHPAHGLPRGPLIMGRYLRELPQAATHAELESVAAHITKEVNAKISGLNAHPFVGAGPGGTTMGFILHEE